MVRLREHKIATERRIDSAIVQDVNEDNEHEIPHWTKEVKSCLQEMPSYDSDVSSIDNLDAKDSELQQQDGDYTEKTKLCPLNLECILLPK